MENEIRIALSSGYDPRGVKEASKSLDDLHKKLLKANKWQLEINADLSRAIHRYAEGMAVDYARAAAEIGEERDRAADLDRLHRDARRYGGSWRMIPTWWTNTTPTRRRRS